MSESQNSKVIRIDFESDDDTVFPAVTNLLVNFDRDQFYVRLYQVKPPTVLDEQLPDRVKAKLVTGFTVTPSKLKEIVRALQENIATYEGHVIEILDTDIESLEDIEREMKDFEDLERDND